MTEYRNFRFDRVLGRYGGQVKSLTSGGGCFICLCRFGRFQMQILGLVVFFVLVIYNALVFSFGAGRGNELIIALILYSSARIVMICFDKTPKIGILSVMIFYYTFFGVAPYINASIGADTYNIRFSPSLQLKTQVILLLSLILIDLIYILKQQNSGSGLIRSTAYTSINCKKVRNLVVLTCGFFIFFIFPYLGKGLFGIRGVGGGEVSTEYMFEMRFYVRIGTLACLVALYLLLSQIYLSLRESLKINGQRRYLSSGGALLGQLNSSGESSKVDNLFENNIIFSIRTVKKLIYITFITLCIFGNPLSLPRYLVIFTWMPLIIMYLLHTPIFKNYVNIIIFFVLFFLLNGMMNFIDPRQLFDDSGFFLGFQNNWSETWVDNFSSGHYDANVVTMMLIDHADTNGLTYGNNILFWVTFWVPRVFFPTKPLSSSSIIGEYNSSIFSNISAPPIGELYCDFGFCGVFGYVLLIALIISWSDRQCRVCMKSSNLIIALVLISGIAISLRGSIVNSLMFSACLICYIQFSRRYMKI